MGVEVSFEQTHLGHWQVNEFTPLIQVPPFLQGELAHSSMSTEIHFETTDCMLLNLQQLLATTFWLIKILFHILALKNTLELRLGSERGYTKLSKVFSFNVVNSTNHSKPQRLSRWWFPLLSSFYRLHHLQSP